MMSPENRNFEQHFGVYEVSGRVWAGALVTLGYEMLTKLVLPYGYGRNPTLRAVRKRGYNKSRNPQHCP